MKNRAAESRDQKDRVNRDRGMRLAQVRAVNYASARAAALANGWPESTYRAHEGGSRTMKKEHAETYAAALGGSFDYIWNGVGHKTLEGTQSPSLPNVSGQRLGVRLSPRRIPVLGRGMSGDDGQLVMNGEVVDTVMCPPDLEHVPDAYAVYVAGDSMEPRYFAGELVYVHPTRPYRRNDFVVVQIDPGNGDPPLGFIKQFITITPTRLVLCQFNPKKEIEFERERVVSIHKIMFAGTP
jgi:phage repressor protein C with HTH and peptisase S24 domain